MTAMPVNVQNTQQSKAWSEVDPKIAAEWARAGQAVIVDVREPDEHASERIDGARLVPLSGFQAERLRGVGNKRIVLHCRGGKRSGDAMRMSAGLQGEGYEVFSLAGGIEGWKAAGLEVVRPAGKRGAGISVMRQVQMVIGVVVVGGTAAGYWVDPRWLILPAFMGCGLMFAGATGTCGLAMVMGWMPWNRVGCGSEGCSGCN
jgi:rhodanese-related sulfurtransferase